MECLDSFERFMHDQEQRLPVLVKAALLHHQFETIHPFLDGNGRLGRLLINLFLCVEGVLEQPILYLSLYLKTHRTRYYELLQDVRETGDWEKWIAFFLEGIEQTATQATEAARTIVTLFERNHSAIENKGGATATTLRIHTALQRLQIVTAKRVSEICNISNPTALRNLGVLEEAGIIKETTGRQRNRVFAYSEYLAILSEGTKPLDR